MHQGGGRRIEIRSKLCHRSAAECLKGPVQSNFVDNTNRNIATRKYYVDICKKLSIPIRHVCFLTSHLPSINPTFRCFLFADTIDLAWHNNLYRAFNRPPSVAEKEVSIEVLHIYDTLSISPFLQPKRTLVPYTAFVSFRNDYEEPTLNEGFSEIKNVHWVFHGTKEESRYWSMWLQIDGK